MPIIKDINPETIRIWADDEEFYFSEQDEDLFLHRPQYVPVLIELAAKNCAKQEYIKAILEYYIQWCFLYKKTTELDEIHNLILESKTLFTTIWLITWRVNFQYIYKIYKNPQRITDAACDKIAKDLTVGDYCKRDFKFLGVLVDGTREYAATTESFHLHFYIKTENGQWKISKYGRLLKFDME